MIDKKVLLIDADYALRSMLMYSLTLEHFEVKEARDFKGAHRELGCGYRPDLVISGYSQPGHEEVAFFRGLRADPDLRETPILLTVSEHDLRDQSRWREAGATCWIMKPFTSGQLLEMVRLMLFRSGGERVATGR